MAKKFFIGRFLTVRCDWITFGYKNNKIEIVVLQDVTFRLKAGVVFM